MKAYETTGTEVGHARTQIRVYGLYPGQQSFSGGVLVDASGVMGHAKHWRTVIHIQENHRHLSFTPQTAAIRRTGNQRVPSDLFAVQRHGSPQLACSARKSLISEQQRHKQDVSLNLTTLKPVCGCIMKSSAPEPNRENWICAFEPVSASVALTWRICLFMGTSSDTDTEYTAYGHKHALNVLNVFDSCRHI